MAARKVLDKTVTLILRPKTFNRVRINSLCTSLQLTEKVTHTGQKFDSEDWKRVRFVDKSKLVNENVAIDLVEEEAPIEVDGRVACCNGGGGALGHPKVFINLDKPGIHDCGYCGLRFVQKSHH